MQSKSAPTSQSEMEEQAAEHGGESDKVRYPPLRTSYTAPIAAQTSAAAGYTN